MIKMIILKMELRINVPIFITFSFDKNFMDTISKQNIHQTFLRIL